MKAPIFAIITILFCLSSPSKISGQNDRTYTSMATDFQNPPTEVWPKVYWWWINGYVDTARLRSELISMKSAGIAGVDIFDIGQEFVNQGQKIVPAGPPFMGEQSLQYLKYAIEQAGKLGIGVRLSVSSSWNAGGAWITPENEAKSIYQSPQVLVSGPEKQSIKLPFPSIKEDMEGNSRHIEFTADGMPAFYEEIAVLAFPAHTGKLDTSQVINLSSQFDAEKEILEWDVPEGEWAIFRYVCANSGKQLVLPSPNSNGPIIDYFDPAATRTHILYFIDHLKPVLGVDHFENTALKGFYLASYEASDLHWTPSLPGEFRKRNGYDIYKFIPAIFDKNLYSTETGENFQFDFKKTMSELMIQNHYRQAREICHEYGLTLTSEAGGPGGWHSIPVETLKALGSLDIPRGEFWYKSVVMDEGDSIDVKQVVKETAAASHIYKRGIVEMEAFTSHQHWQEGPFDLKPFGDRAFCEGMNSVIIHGFSHEPVEGNVPGTVYHAGTHFNDRNPWWPKIKPFNEYLARISFISRKSDFVADVLYYYGDNVPNLVPPKNTRYSVGPGYDYEVVNTEILLNKVTVDGEGMLLIPGVGRYKVLCLTEKANINEEVLSKLARLAAAGAVIVGNKPESPAGIHTSEEIENYKNLVDKCWVKQSSGAFDISALKHGVIYSGLSPLEVLKAMDVPVDFSYEGNQTSWTLKGGKRSPLIDYIHYKTDSVDFYLIRNTTDGWVSKNCSFRQKDRMPEIWDPVSGKIITVPVYNEQATQIALPITLAPYEAYFVVFRNKDSSNHYTEVTTHDNQIPLVRFTPTGIQFLQKGQYELKKEGTTFPIDNKTEIINLDKTWDLYFPAGWGAPDSIHLQELISWTEVPDEGVKYFSGTAKYSKFFEFDTTLLQEGSRVYLDLGDVAEVAEVWLNEQLVGTVWAKPYWIDISDYLKRGKNLLEVEVANTWKNRLIGDDHTGSHFTTTNITRGNPNLPRTNFLTHNMGKAPWRELPLRESGLLGPVTIRIAKLYK